MTILRNFAGLLFGLFCGAVVNMAIVMTGPLVIPPPPGVDVTNAESIAASIHLFGPKHFIVPFVAHAAGTFVGATVAYLVSATYRMSFAFAVGAMSFAGGVAASQMIPAPMWFIVVDLAGAYFPMAWLATLVARRFAGESLTDKDAASGNV